MKTDVCLVLEGTYPYVYGGVSSWIHTIVKSLGEFRFSLIHISSTGDIIRTPKYDIPPNIVEFREVFIHDFKDDRSRTSGNKEDGWRVLSECYRKFGIDDLSGLEKFYEYVIDKKTRRLNIHDMMFSRRGWDMMLELYRSIAPDVSFVDFFWTIRFIHIPILNIFRADIPEASLYHTACTGYAGLLSAIAKVSRKAPVVLTEHGIYTYERKIDISRAEWIYSKREKALRATRSLGFFKDFWIMKFELLSRLTYYHADRIVTLFEGNRQAQIEGGADPSRTLIIPNGVEYPELPAPAAVDRPAAPTVGFVGRVVSIKDIKTFIRAMKIVQSQVSDVKIYIMGSGDEEPAYFEECKTLVGMLGLQDNVVFTDIVDVRGYYPILDVVVLTSISEAQPLSILEAMSYGVPSVATNVGSCRELLLGRDSDDVRLGPSGIIAGIGNPTEIASGVVSILKDAGMRRRMGEAGRRRVKKYYTIDAMIDSYRGLYESYLGKVRAADEYAGAVSKAQ